MAPRVLETTRDPAHRDRTQTVDARCLAHPVQYSRPHHERDAPPGAP
jgi:hypothetical protein